jgi:hypothetical protein
MGWEYRSGGGPYYIRRRIVNGRSVREYCGKGPVAERAAAEDARVRAIQEAERTQQYDLQTLDSQSAEVSMAIEMLMQAWLLGAGLHQHHRGEWRKRRV